MTHQRRKKLSYAYATSPAAERLNGGAGCWLVDDESGLPPIVYQDSEKYGALRVFELINLPVNTLESFTREHDCFLDLPVLCKMKGE